MVLFGASWGLSFFLGKFSSGCAFSEVLFPFQIEICMEKIVLDHFTTFAFFSLARSFAHLRRKTTFFDHRDHSKKNIRPTPLSYYGLATNDLNDATSDWRKLKFGAP